MSFSPPSRPRRVVFVDSDNVTRPSRTVLLAAANGVSCASFSSFKSRRRYRGNTIRRRALFIAFRSSALARQATACPLHTHVSACRASPLSLFSSHLRRSFVCALLLQTVRVVFAMAYQVGLLYSCVRRHLREIVEIAIEGRLGEKTSLKWTLVKSNDESV